LFWAKLTQQSFERRLIDVKTLRQQVESRLPGWEVWYPSVFDAARDLGIIKAEVCSPSSLLLSNRHARIQRSAEHAHREKWGGAEEHPQTSRTRGPRRTRRK
jgi:hypothetical protein